MGYLSEKQFKNLKSPTGFEKKLYFYNINKTPHILKMLNDEKDVILALSKKKVDKVILPLELFDVGNRKEIMYLMEYANCFFDIAYIDEYAHNYSDKELLCFFRKLFIKLNEIHDNGICSGDLHSENILIDDSLDYRFIDFDSGIVDDVISSNARTLNMYFNNDLDIRDNLIFDDKKSLLYGFVNFIINGKYDINLSKSIFDKDIPKYLRYLLDDIYNKKEMVENNDYFIDIIDDLIENKYQLTYRRNM